ncbi:hypothetical protein N9123_01400 [Pseudomonadales bacterium]|nr:hypothetical protein [Pseudomonadales bacterium]
MALVLNDRVRETSTTTGTGAMALGGAVVGFQTFAAGVGNSNTCYYAISLRGGAEFETGLGTLDGDSSDLTRTTVFQSSNSDSAVDFSAGTKDVFVTLPASKAVFEDATTDNVTLTADLSVGDDLTVNGGVIDVKNTGAQSVVRFYCESSNAHYAEIKAPAHSAFSGNVSLTLPAVTDTLVGLAATQTLTNKTLTTPVLTTPIANAGVQLKNGATSAGFLEFFEDSDNGTNKVTLIGPASTADVTIVLPAAADTLIGKATTDTLTNKSIDSDNNTITNLVNADIKASAAIAFSKMENLTASRALVSDGSGDVSVSAVTSTEVGYLDGVTSAIQTQINTKTTAGFAVAMAIAL